MAITLDTPIRSLKDVNLALAKKMEKLTIKTTQDFLYYFPRDYDDRRCLPTISQVVAGKTVTLLGRVESISEDKRPAHAILKGVLVDATGWLGVIWFNQMYMAKLLSACRYVLVKGKVVVSAYTHRLQMTVYETEPVWSDADLPHKTGRVFPVYLLTHGLYQSQMRGMFMHIQDVLTDK